MTTLTQPPTHPAPAVPDETPHMPLLDYRIQVFEGACMVRPDLSAGPSPGFVPAPPDLARSRNVHHVRFRLNLSSGRIEVGPGDPGHLDRSEQKTLRLGEVISSQLLLYRLLIAVPGVRIESPGGRSAWRAFVKSSAGGVVMLGDYKGSPTVHCEHGEGVQTDAAALLGRLCDPGFTHDYGNVAGVEA